VGNIDGQLRARPRGPGELHLLLNRGSEVFRAGAEEGRAGADGRAGAEGVELLQRRTASDAQEAALDRAAALAVQGLGARGLEARIVSQRLNRRKIDLTPTQEWADPPKARIAQLLAAVQARLREHGLDGLGAAVELGEQAAAQAGLPGARVSSDAKHIEIGLTDKSDSARWYFAHLWRRGVAPEQVLIVGDELGALGGLPGSDSKLLIDAAAAATVASVGVEPAGVPSEVLAIGGGPAAFQRLLDRQLALRRRGALPIVPSDPCWTLRVDAVDEHERERAHESLLTLADGRLGTRGSVLEPHHGSTPAVLMAGVYRGHGERSELQPAPLWNRLAPLAGDRPVSRVLDLHAGLLYQETPGAFRALQFCSLAEPGLAVLRALAPREELERSPPLVLPPHTDADEQHDGAVMRIAVAQGVLEAAAVQSLPGRGKQAALERIAAYATTTAEDSSNPALRCVQLARQTGGERLLSDHRRAFAETTDADLDRAERLAWPELADALVDGYQPDSGVYEQFAGFFELNPLLISELDRSEIGQQRPIAAEELLSPERVHQAQVIKQADVLMLHHLVPEEVAPGSLSPNLAFYEPRTAHSSSLSPGIHAALLARAGRLAEARTMLDLAARIDLDDVSRSTASGVHIAAMGSVWQALVLGFGGARPRGEVLQLDPRLAGSGSSCGCAFGRLSCTYTRARARSRSRATSRHR